MVRGRCRVAFDDAMAFRRQRSEERRKFLDDLAQDTQEIERLVG